MEQASFIWGLELSSALLSLGQLPTFNFRGFQRHEVFESSFAVKFFNSGTSSFWGHNHFAPFWRCACLHWAPPAMRPAPPTSAGSTFLGSAISPLDSIYVLLKFYSWHYHSSLLCATLSFLLASSFFRWIIVVKCHMGFSLGKKKVSQPHALLSVYDLNDGCSVTCHWQTLKEVTWLVIDCDGHLLFP